MGAEGAPMPKSAMAERTNAVVAMLVSLSAAAGVGALGSPVNDGLANAAFLASSFAMVVAKFGSSPSAAASSFKVSSVPGAEATRLATAVITNAVFANCALFVPGLAVG